MKIWAIGCMILVFLVGVAPVARADDPIPIVKYQAEIMALDMAYIYEVVALTWDTVDVAAFVENVLPAVVEKVRSNPALYGEMIELVISQENVLEELGTLALMEQLSNDNPYWPIWRWPWPWPWDWDCIPAPDAMRGLIRQVIEEYPELENGGMRQLISDDPAHAGKIIGEAVLRTAAYVLSEQYEPRLNLLMNSALPIFLNRMNEDTGLLQSWDAILDMLDEVTGNAELETQAALLQLDLLNMVGEDASLYGQWTPLYHGTLAAMLLASDSLVATPTIPLPPP